MADICWYRRHAHLWPSGPVHRLRADAPAEETGRGCQMTVHLAFCQLAIRNFRPGVCQPDDNHVSGDYPGCAWFEAWCTLFERRLLRSREVRIVERSDWPAGVIYEIRRGATMTEREFRRRLPMPDPLSAADEVLAQLDEAV